MNEHFQFDEDFDLYALGALDQEEKLAFESHLLTCEDCTAKLAAAQERIGLFGLSAPPVEPPLRVKEQLLARIHETLPAASPEDTQKYEQYKESQRAFLWHRPAFAWTVAASMTVLCLIFAVGSYRQAQQLRAYQDAMQTQNAAITRAHTILDLLTARDTQTIILTQASEKPRMEARAYYHPSRGLIFYATNMPAAPAGHAYQLWLVPTQGPPISAGVFDVNQRGNASIVLPTLPAGIAAKAFAVTVEPAGGMPQPTGPKVLVGAM